MSGIAKRVTCPDGTELKVEATAEEAVALLVRGANGVWFIGGVGRDADSIHRNIPEIYRRSPYSVSELRSDTAAV